ncbi:unnamed protein product [Rhizoctonia solani]|uniref:Uncharacterized protein n=1 Tax=Rhizoctonia solani TaxID=456999 RepID=A0A8H3B584_9AGAM|nr:unnamed protein product [Rhizoctonia solani]
MEDQSYKLANIAGYTSRHYDSSNDWAGALHKWLPPEFKSRRRRKNTVSIQSQAIQRLMLDSDWRSRQPPLIYQRITRQRGPGKHRSITLRSLKVRVPSQIKQPPLRLPATLLSRPEIPPKKRQASLWCLYMILEINQRIPWQPRGLGYGPGSGISSGPRFAKYTPSRSWRKQGGPTVPDSPRQINTLTEGMESLTLVSGASSDHFANVSTSGVRPQESNQTLPQNALGQNTQLGNLTIIESSTSEMQRMVETMINDLRGLDIRSGQSASAPTNLRVQPAKQAKRPERKTTKPQGQNDSSPAQSKTSQNQAPRHKAKQNKGTQNKNKEANPSNTQNAIKEKKRNPKNKGEKPTATAAGNLKAGTSVA